jgi:uncharacterized protein (TIGR02588 family)
VTPSKRSGQRRPRATRTIAEWGLFGSSAAVVLVVVVALALDWANGGADPAAFRTEIGPVVSGEGGHQVAVEVENTGGQAAAEVVVAAELALRDEIVEAEQTIDFLAGGERVEVTFVFADDPGAGRLTVQVTSYREP